MTNQFLKDKFEYNYAYNLKVIAQLKEHPHTYVGLIRKLICHTLNAQNIWNHRILGKPFTQRVWDEFPLSELPNLNLENHTLSLKIVNEFSMEKAINYQNTKGDKFSNTVEDILFHIINHGTYHRGQIVSQMKTIGVAPIESDFIIHKR